MAVLCPGKRNKTERKLKNQKSDILSITALKNSLANQCVNIERVPSYNAFRKHTDLFILQLESL